MTAISKPQGALFVGSVPLPTAEETFTNLSSALPGRLRRIPDGEPGVRGYWTWYLYLIFPDWALSPLSYPAKKAFERGDPDPGPPFWFGNMLPAPERQPGEVMTVKAPPYAQAAIESYAVFKKLKDEGKIEPQVRFQVSIATSLSIICSHILAPYRTEADAKLEPLILESIKDIQEAIPAQELAIQLDLACEMGVLEKELDNSPDLFFTWFEKGITMSEIVPRIVRSINAIQEPVEVGLHFCYGDVGHQHWGQPKDMGVMVALFNELRKSGARHIGYIHMPVPVDRDDEAYFEPLTTLNIDQNTELYLGVVREQDAEGSKRRLATAQRVVKRSFGIATECGLGRVGDAALVEDVLSTYSELAGPI